MGSEIISQGYGERVLESAGGYWNMAEAAAKETASNASGAAANTEWKPLISIDCLQVEGGHIVESPHL